MKPVLQITYVIYNNTLYMQVQYICMYNVYICITMCVSRPVCQFTYVYVCMTMRICMCTCMNTIRYVLMCLPLQKSLPLQVILYLLDHVDMHTYFVYVVSEWYINLRLSFFGVGNFNYEGVMYIILYQSYAIQQHHGTSLRLHCACRLYSINYTFIVCSISNLSCMINGDHVYTFLIMYPHVLLVKRIIFNLFLSVLLMISTANAKQILYSRR